MQMNRKERRAETHKKRCDNWNRTRNEYLARMGESHRQAMAIRAAKVAKRKATTAAWVKAAKQAILGQ